MKKINVYDLPVVPNICNQILREIPDTPSEWSLAHVTMNPREISALHAHERTTEVYVITKGIGELEVGMGCMTVRAGNVTVIDSGRYHRLKNIGIGCLEHLVLASPKFDPSDVVIYPDRHEKIADNRIPPHRVPVECFDGTLITECSLPLELKINLSFIWVSDDLNRRKKPHFHEDITENIFCIEGKSIVELDNTLIDINDGDLLTIPPGSRHRFIHNSNRDMVALCISSKVVDDSDMHYDITP